MVEVKEHGVMYPTDEFVRPDERMSKCPFCGTLNILDIKKKRPIGVRCKHFSKIDEDQVLFVAK